MPELYIGRLIVDASLNSMTVHQIQLAFMASDHLLLSCPNLRLWGAVIALVQANLAESMTESPANYGPPTPSRLARLEAVVAGNSEAIASLTHDHRKMAVIIPKKYRVFERRGDSWVVKGSKLNSKVPTGLKDAHNYGLTPQKIIVDITKAAGIKQGFYIGDLEDQRYFYCGPEFSDVVRKFHLLGIGRPDPLEGCPPEGRG